MNKKSLVGLLFCSVLFISFSSKSFSQTLDPEDVLRTYRTLSDTDSRVFETLILPYLRHEFSVVVTDPETGRERGILARRSVFYTLYRTLTKELSQQKERPFREYDPFTKINRSTLRFIMHAMASDTESIFYGIHDDVFDELFADDEGPLPGFKQLTYEPLLNEYRGSVIAVPLAVIATALIARVLPDRRARVAAATIAGVLAIFGASGCSSTQPANNSDDEEEEELPDELHESLIYLSTKWKLIEKNQRAYQDRTLETVEPIFYSILEATDSQLVLSESRKRQLYAPVFVTVVDFMIPYFKDEAFQDAENESWRQQHPEDGNGEEDPNEDGELEDDFPEDDDGDDDDDDDDIPTDGTVESLQEKVIWSKFLEHADRYISDPALLTILSLMNQDQRRIVLLYLFERYADYDEIWLEHEAIVANIKNASEKIGLGFDDEFDRRDKLALEQYISELEQWVINGPTANTLQYEILTDLEREFIENMTQERLEELQSFLEED